LIQKLDRVIIGGSLESMLYAWRTQTKILVKEKKYVFRFCENFFPTTFPDFHCDNPKHLSSNLSFALSLTGLMPYGGNIENIRAEDNLIKVITKGNRRVEIEADEIIFFDGLLDDYWVYDFFDSRKMKAHDTKVIYDDTDDFIKKINFYSSPRSRNVLTRDFIGSSKMTHKQLLSPDYGPGIAKLKVMRMLKEAGLKGPFSQTYKGKDYFKKPKIEFHKRVVAQEYQPLYDFETIYNMEQQKEKAWKTFEILKKKGETL
jgi:hypothetical protein